MITAWYHVHIHKVLPAGGAGLEHGDEREDPVEERAGVGHQQLLLLQLQGRHEQLAGGQGAPGGGFNLVNST